jgi:DNA-binding CsgD family transcriptional regulator
MEYPINPNNIHKFLYRLSEVKCINTFATELDKSRREDSIFNAVACIVGEVGELARREIFNVGLSRDLLSGVVNDEELFKSLEIRNTSGVSRSVFCDISSVKSSYLEQQVYIDYGFPNDYKGRLANGRLYCCFVILVDSKKCCSNLELVALFCDQIRKKVFAIIENALVMSKARALLSPRELEVLRWISRGKSTEEISNILNISIWTVKSHVKKVLSKLGAVNRSDAVSKAVGLDLIDITELNVDMYTYSENIEILFNSLDLDRALM